LLTPILGRTFDPLPGQPAVSTPGALAGAFLRQYELVNLNQGAKNMNATGFVVPPGGGAVLDMEPGRSAALKLLGGQTAESVMLFEETAPPGTATPFHLHHDSDEVAYVLSGEITFLIGDKVTVGGPGSCAFLPRTVPHAWKNTGAETGRVLFLYTPADAGKLFEERVGNPAASLSDAEFEEMARRHRWEVVGPAPL
jgi:quercetin dioxygenase-like cupin family protein